MSWMTKARRSPGAVLLLFCLLADHCAATAATATGIAGATVTASPLSAAVALYVRPSHDGGCVADCAAAGSAEGAVALGRDGIAQFSMYGDTTSNYVVQISDAALRSAWSGWNGMPITLEPMPLRGGGVSIVIGSAPSSVLADAFQVVINFN